MTTIEIKAGDHVYAVRQVPKGHVASIINGPMGEECLHRDARTLEESMRLVGLHISSIEAAKRQAANILHSVGLGAMASR